MIVYDLICEADHRFEAWFSSMEDFERQAGTPMLVCPVCSSGEVRRAPAGIHTRRPGGRAEPSSAAMPEPVDARESEPDHGHVAARLVVIAFLHHFILWVIHREAALVFFDLAMHH